MESMYGIKVPSLCDDTIESSHAFGILGPIFKLISHYSTHRLRCKKHKKHVADYTRESLIREKTGTSNVSE